ncbi:MAG: hypothetical protein JO057_16400, partial [Chloroflexi bacterium]|nr:hypothetical protein [Chloroflexota bacterium]
FASRVAWTYVGASLALYVGLVLATSALDQADLKVLVVRLVTIATVAGLGNRYWRGVRYQKRVERDEHTAAALAWQAARAG